MSSQLRAEKPIRVLDLFAGAGGLSQGLRTGSDRYVTVRAVEMDKAAAASYAANHGKGTVYVGPIQDWLDSREALAVDLIIGGPPCQGFSTLGKQDEEDDRNILWRKYLETILLTRPKYFVVENVAAFMKSKQYEAFLAETSEFGMLRDFAFHSRVVNAADYGAAQARRRTVIIGYLKSLGDPGFPEPTHGPGRAMPYVTVDETFRGISLRPDGIELPRNSAHDLDAKAEILGPFSVRDLHLGRNYTKLSLDRFATIPINGNRFDIPDSLLPECWKRHQSGSADVMGRLRADRPSVTIRTEFFKPEKGRYLHPTEDRAITHYEAALLQGFPEDYKFYGSKTAIARQIGNAVPIPLGVAIGRHLAQRM